MLWPSPVSSSCWGRQGKSRKDLRGEKWAGVFQKRWSRPRVLSTSQVLGWPPHPSAILQALFLTYDVHIWCISHSLPLLIHRHYVHIPDLIRHLYVHTSKISSSSAPLLNTRTHTPAYPSSQFTYSTYVLNKRWRGKDAAWSLRKAFVSQY